MHRRTDPRPYGRIPAASHVVLCLAVTACLDRAQPTPAEPALPFGLVVRPPWAALQPAGSVQLEAAVVGPAGDTMPLQAVAWSARSGAVRVDATGRATGITNGVDTVIASSGQRRLVGHDQWRRFHSRRQRLPRWHDAGVCLVLRPNLGTASRTHPTDAGGPRLSHRRSSSLLLVFRGE